ncbi:MAG: TIGR03768 family metallophosphoesterase [Deltaproteobacteria bacterium]|nr:TIGR03768 family metallophosphoesterase [Candidatus Zymogenaceae bacterium]
MANDDPTKSRDAKKSSNVTRREFIKYSGGTAVCISLGTFNFAYSGSGVSGYPIDSAVYTTLHKTVKLNQTFSGTIAAQDLKNISQYDTYGYGVWIDGGPLTSVPRKDIMATGYTFPSVNKSLKFLRFFTISDIHITDKESPSQLIYMQQLNKYGFEATATSVYSPTMLYTTHVLDAAIQTVNALHKIDPIDFGISLGDTCNSTLYNELRWYIDVLDGKVITPCSGARVGADRIDYQKPYKAAGLDPSIPWYQAIGNHDHFWLGSIPVEAGGLKESFTSDEVIAMGDLLAEASNIYSKTPPLYYMGVIDGSTPTGTIIKAGTVGDPGFTSPPKVVPDKDRRSLSRTQWKREFFNTSTGPVGHGFDLVPSGQDDGFLCYSFVPKSDIPIKVIVLDDTQREDDGLASIHGRGFLDQARWVWLKDELAAGDSADQLMIIACHVPIGVMPPAANNNGSDTYMDWFDNSANPSGMQNAVDLTGLLAELHNHPNLLMWIAGHRHVNTVKAFVTDDAARPERGFWHVETSSLHDFPQQLRTFEINLNSDYTISIVTTNVDPAVKEGTPAWTARKYAVAAQQIVKNSLNPNLKGADPTVPGYPNVVDPSITISNGGMDTNILSYNAQLFKQLSPAMKAKMRTLYPTV